MLAANVINVGTHDFLKGVVNVRSMSLENLSRVVLGQSVSKHSEIRVSSWLQVPDVTKLQYAALDAYAGILIFDRVISGRPPADEEFSANNAAVGTRVLIFNSNNEAVASGEVVDPPKHHTDRKDVDLFGQFYRQTVTPLRAVVKLDEVFKSGECTPLLLHRKDGGPAEQPLYVDVFGDHGYVLVAKSMLRKYRDVVPAAVPAPISTAEQLTADDPLDPFNSTQTEEQLARGLDPPVVDALREPSPSVKGDVMHACKNITESCKKKHPSFGKFARMLGDAFLLPVAEDVKVVEKILSNLGLDAKAIDKLRRKHWKAVFLRDVRRTTGPSRVRLLRRFMDVIDKFKKCIDPATNEPLLREGTLRKIKATALKIAAGYYTDPEGVDMYRFCGRTRKGLDKWQCLRGTNSLEGFHHHLNRLCAQHQTAPRLAYSLILNFNTRWNMDRARQYLGRADDLQCYYDQGRLEEIVMLCRQLDVAAPFQIRCSFEFNDTGETFGLVRDKQDGLREAFQNVQFAPVTLDDDALPVEPPPTFDDVLEWASSDMGLSPDEKWMAAREGTLIPVRNFDYDQNKKEYLEFLDLLKGGGSVGVGRYGGPDFDELARLWEERVILEEERLMTTSARVPRKTSRQTQSTAATSPLLPVPGIFRKTIKQIERFYDSVHRFMGKSDAFDLNAADLNALADRLHRGDVAPQTGRPRSEPVATGTDTSQGFATMAATLPLTLATAVLPRGEANSASVLAAAQIAPSSTTCTATANATATATSEPFVSPTLLVGQSGPVIYPAHQPRKGSVVSAADIKRITAMSSNKRKPQSCATCGHYKLIGHYAQFHSAHSQVCPFALEPDKCIAPGGRGVVGFCWHYKKGNGCDYCRPFCVAAENIWGERARTATLKRQLPVAHAMAQVNVPAADGSAPAQNAAHAPAVHNHVIVAAAPVNEAPV
jgi:hypothetical protein